MNKKRLFQSGILGLCILLFTGCQGEDIKERVRSLASSEFSTVEYTITKVVKANDESFYTVGNRKILFSCKAIVKAGVDLSKLTTDDIELNPKSKKAEITLPAAEVLSFNMPLEEAKLVYEKIGSLRFSFTAEERNNLLTQGEEDIRADLEHLGILKDAEENTKMFFKALLQQFGYNNIEVKFKEKEEA